MSDKYELSVIVNGDTVKKFSHDGKLFIAGYNGSEYILRVSNNTDKRVLAIISVDGINVVDGKEASEQSTGYIVAARSAVNIKGFRESETHVGAFKFATKGKSYTKETITGSTKDCGVIGCMIVEEKAKIDPYKELLKKMEQMDQKIDSKPSYVPPVYIPYEPYPYRRYWYNEPYYWGTTYCGGVGGVSIGTTTGNNIGSCITSSCVAATSHAGSDNISYTANIGSVSRAHAKSTKSAAEPVMMNYCHTDLGSKSLGGTSFVQVIDEPAEFDLGSTWGQRLLDKVDMVTFERGSIVDTFTIYYASKDVLIAMGVPLTLKKEVSFPSPFPGKFCTPPKSISG